MLRRRFLSASIAWGCCFMPHFGVGRAAAFAPHPLIANSELFDHNLRRSGQKARYS